MPKAPKKGEYRKGHLYSGFGDPSLASSWVKLSKEQTQAHELGTVTKYKGGPTVLKMKPIYGDPNAQTKDSPKRGLPSGEDERIGARNVLDRLRASVRQGRGGTSGGTMSNSERDLMDSMKLSNKSIMDILEAEGDLPYQGEASDIAVENFDLADRDRLTDSLNSGEIDKGQYIDSIRNIYLQNLDNPGTPSSYFRDPKLLEEYKRGQEDGQNPVDSLLSESIDRRRSS